MEDLVKSSRKTIYCQLQFLESICKNDNDTYGSNGDVNFLEIIRDSIIYFDKSEEVIKSHQSSNYYITKLIKMDIEGDCFIDWQEGDLKLKEYVNDYIERDGINDFSPILFVYQAKKQQKSNNNLCQKYNSLYGLMMFDQDSYKEMEYVFQDCGCAIKKDSENGWKDSFAYKRFFGNSLIVIDDYLIDKTDSFAANLYELLDIFLPCNQTIPFYLTFISSSKNYDFNVRAQAIENKVKELRPKYFQKGNELYGKIRMNIIEDSNNVFHDRVILTNYCWISCGCGFDLYKNNGKAKHSTTISLVYPFLQNRIKWSKEAYLNFICDSREVFDKVEKNHKWYGGDLSKNRLLMMDKISENLT